MNRRHFVTSIAAGAALGQSLSAAGRLPIRKGILLGMLPKNLSVIDRFKLARDCGFESMEIGTVDDPGEAEQIKKAGEETRFPIHSVMNRDHWQFPISSPKPEVADKSVKGMEISLRNAKLWGADTVLLVPAVVNADIGYQDAWNRSQDVIRKRILPLATELKIVVGIENVWNKFLLSPPEFCQYVDSFKSPWVRAYFDVGNVALYGFSQDWIRTLGKRICKLHFKDFAFRRDQQIKKTVADWPNLLEGDLNWKAIHAAIAEIGFKGDATVELSGGDAAYLKDLSGRVDKILEGV